MYPTVAGKVWPQELEAAGPIVPVVKKERDMKKTVLLNFCFVFN